MKITERKSPYSGKLEWTYYEIDKNEFEVMPREEKYKWLRGIPGRNTVKIQGLISYNLVKRIDENTVLLRNDKFKKIIFNLDTCEKTPISQIEYEKMTNKVDTLKKKRERLLKELAKIEAEIEMLENE